MRWNTVVERLCNKLENWRGVATRYDKTAEPDIGFVSLASVLRWMPRIHDARMMTYIIMRMNFGVSISSVEAPIRTTIRAAIFCSLIKTSSG